LYFEAPDGPGLLAEERAVPFASDLARQLRSVIEALAKGSATGLGPPLAPETKVLEVFVTAAGVAYVDLSKEALTSVKGGSKDDLRRVSRAVTSTPPTSPATNRVQSPGAPPPPAPPPGPGDFPRPLPADMPSLPPPSPPPTPSAEATPADGTAP